MGYVRCFNDDGSECQGFEQEDHEGILPDSGADATDWFLAREEAEEEEDPYERGGDDDEDDDDPCASSWGRAMCQANESCDTCPLDKERTKYDDVMLSKFKLK